MTRKKKLAVDPIDKLNPQAQWRGRMRKAALEKLGNKCARCGFDDVRALQIDHIKSVGHKDRPAHYITEKDVVEGDTSKYQLRCSNCNWIKRAELREHTGSRLQLVLPFSPPLAGWSINAYLLQPPFLNEAIATARRFVPR